MTGQQILLERWCVSNQSTVAHRTVILPVVLYGCEMWSLILREEHRCRVYENMVLRWIFGPERDEVTRKWRKLSNEELSNVYCSPNIECSNREELKGACSTYGGEVRCIQCFGGETWGKRPLWRPRRR
jgi:hypothetical protein